MIPRTAKLLDGASVPATQTKSAAATVSSFLSSAQVLQITPCRPRASEPFPLLWRTLLWKLPLLPVFASLQAPFGNISLAFLQAAPPQPSLFLDDYLVLCSAAALFHPVGTARVDSSVPLSLCVEMHRGSAVNLSHWLCPSRRRHQPGGCLKKGFFTARAMKRCIRCALWLFLVHLSGMDVLV